MMIFLYAIFTIASLGISGVFGKEMPLTSNPLPTSIPTTPTLTQTAITLISPDDQEILDNGRTDFLDYTVWDFDWSDIEGATRYHLFVVDPLGSPHIDDDNITSSSYHLESQGYQTSDCLEGWTWGVRAYCNGQWNEWSDTRKFDVEPPNTDPAWDTPTPLTPTLTPTLTTTPTDNPTPEHITIEMLYDLEGAFPFVLPFHLTYLLLLVLAAPAE